MMVFHENEIRRITRKKHEIRGKRAKKASKKRLKRDEKRENRRIEKRNTTLYNASSHQT